MARKKTPKANNSTPKEPVTGKATDSETVSDEVTSTTDTTAKPEDTDAPTQADEAVNVDKDASTEQTAEKDAAENKNDGDEPQGEPGASSVDAQPADATDAVDATEPPPPADPEPTVEDDQGKTKEPVQTPAAVEQVVVKKGGFLPMLLGGVVAGGVGFAAAYYGYMQQPDTTSDLAPRIDELTSEISLQAETLDGLQARVDALPDAPDLAPLDSRISEIAAKLDGLNADLSANQADMSALSNQLEQIDGRVSQLEQAPITDGASDEAVAAYERELQEAQDQIAQQLQDARDQIEQQLNEMESQAAELNSMIAEAQETEAEAAEAATAAMQNSAISRITAAVESGSSFSEPLADLETTGVEVPEALSTLAEEGPPSAASLQASFPDVAREALTASRDAAADSGEVGGFADFMRSQLGARSLEPQEGDSPDAVLSRAEAAVREGRLGDAISELDSLPEAGKASVSDWVAQANRRLDALNAVQELSEKVN